MSTKSLRGLGKAYAAGLIDRRTYIHERRQLIDGVASGEIPIVHYSTPDPEDPALDRTFSDGEITLEVPAAGTAKTPRPVPLILLIVIAIALAGAAVFMMSGKRGAMDSADTPPPDAIVADKSTTAEKLIANFIAKNGWDIGPLNALIVAWHALPAEDRFAFEGTPASAGFVVLIQEKFTEERALVALGEELEGLETQRKLLELGGLIAPADARVQRMTGEWKAAWSDYQYHQRQIAVAGDEFADTVAQAAATDETQDESSAESRPEQAPADPAPPATTVSDPEPAVAAAAMDTEAPPSTAAVMEAPEAAIAAPEPPPAETGRMAGPPPTVGAQEQSTPEPLPPAAAVSPKSQASTAERRDPCPASLAKQRRPYCRDPVGSALKGPGMVVIAPGTFEMGGRRENEQPRRAVEISPGFAMSMYEISYGEFEQFCKATNRACPQQPWSDPSLPVVNVSWSLANEYTAWLSETSGERYRLPSEAEWEYAARAGTSSPYPFGDEILPTHARFSFMRTEATPLAANDRGVNRNPFRLYHMLGNVREWVTDIWVADYSGAPADGSPRTGSGEQRVARGGSYADSADELRSASRIGLNADRGDDKTGIRVLREVD